MRAEGWIALVLIFAIVAPVVGFSAVAGIMQWHGGNFDQAQTTMTMLKDLLGPLLGVIVGTVWALFGFAQARQRSD